MSLRSIRHWRKIMAERSPARKEPAQQDVLIILTIRHRFIGRQDIPLDKLMWGLERVGGRRLRRGTLKGPLRLCHRCHSYLGATASLSHFHVSRRWSSAGARNRERHTIQVLSHGG